jgi:hypothetical protein
MHWYYLHTNGDLLHKRLEPDDDSNFVRRVWPLDTSDRGHAWILLIEAMALGARTERIRELATKWRCDAKDLPQFIRRHTNPTPEQQKGLRLFIEHILNLDPETYFDWLAATPKGAEPDFESMPVPA